MNNASKTVIVTGGSRGLGLGIVQMLLAEGYRVATCSRSKTPELAHVSSQFPADQLFWMSCEGGKENLERDFFDACIAWSGSRPLYGLINNMGIAGEGVLATFPNVDSAKILDVNLLSAIRFSRMSLQVLLRQNKGGRMLNISSIVGIRGYAGLAAYSASKAGLDGLTRALAREVGRRKITVNSIAPGYFESALSSSLGAAQKHQIINRTPLGRLAQVADIVPAVRFLLTPEAGFITGQTIVIDGGITC